MVLRRACLSALIIARDVRFGVCIKIVLRARAIASSWNCAGLARIGANGRVPRRDGPHGRNASGIICD